MIKRMLAAVLAFLAMSVFAAVDANKATSAELDGVKGIGPAIAAKITAERAKSPFKDWDDLVSRVSGIGEKTAVKLSASGLTVNGATYKGVAATPTPPKQAVPTPPGDPKADAAKAKADAKADAKAAAKADKDAAKQAARDKKAAAAATAASAAKK